MWTTYQMLPGLGHTVVQLCPLMSHIQTRALTLTGNGSKQLLTSGFRVPAPLLGVKANFARFLVPAGGLIFLASRTTK